MVHLLWKSSMVAPPKLNKDDRMPRKHIKKQRQQFADKGRYRQGYGFSSSYIWMGELDHKEG